MEIDPIWLILSANWLFLADPLNGHTTGSLGGLGLTGWLAGSYVRWISQRTNEFDLGSDRATGLI